jgi:hypothetical protein
MRIMKCGILLILILALGLSGCHVQPAETTVPAETTAAPTEPTFPRPVEEPLDLTEKEPYEEGEKEVSCRLLPETVDNPENLPVLKWISFCTSYPDDTRIYVSYANDKQWSEEAADEVNAMLAAYDLPFRIQFVLFTTEEKRIDWLRVPEVRVAMADADLITGLFTEAEAINYLTPVTEYVSEDAEVSLSGLVPHELSWELATYDGEVYGLPIGRAFPMTGGWHVRDEVFTEYGFTIEDFQKDFLSMDEVFAELYEKTGNKGFLYMNYGSSLTWTQRDGATVIWPGRMHNIIDSLYDCVGLCYAIDYSGDKPVVVNYLETEYFTQACEKMFDYSKYQYKNTDANQLVSYGPCYSAYPARYYDESGYRWLIPVEETSVSLGYSQSMTGILKNSDQQALALRLLETMGEDETFRKQFLFGQEGKDYEVVDGWYQPLSRQDGSYSMKFLSGMSPFCGPIYDDYITQEFILPETEEMTRLEAYQSSVEQSKIWVPIQFNWTEMRNEHREIEQILRKYCSWLPFTSDNVNEAMLAEIREAGGDRVKRELQRQLDEWFAENPEWLELCKPDKTEN